MRDPNAVDCMSADFDHKERRFTTQSVGLAVFHALQAGLAGTNTRKQKTLDFCSPGCAATSLRSLRNNHDSTRHEKRSPTAAAACVSADSDEKGGVSRPIPCAQVACALGRQTDIRKKKHFILLCSCDCAADTRASTGRETRRTRPSVGRCPHSPRERGFENDMIVITVLIIIRWSGTM